MGKLGDALQEAVRPSLDAGEELRGVCVATQQSMFKGRSVALAATDRRLLVQCLDRRFNPDGPPLSLTRETLAGASADGAGGGWLSVGAAIMDGAAITLKLKTVDGQSLKLNMMSGSGVFGKLGGGEDQRAGVDAVAAWFAENAG